MITATVKGTKQLERKLSILSVVITDAVFEAIALKALSIQSDAIRGIAKISAGMRTPKGKVVSKPGDPPNTQTGRLIGSIRVQKDKSANTVAVTSRVKYGVWLEFGTKKMEARPWFTPAVNKNKKFQKKDFKFKVQKL